MHMGYKASHEFWGDSVLVRVSQGMADGRSIPRGCQKINSHGNCHPEWRRHLALLRDA